MNTPAPGADYWFSVCQGAAAAAAWLGASSRRERENALDRFPFSEPPSSRSARGMAIIGATVVLTENAPIPGILRVQTDATGAYSITMNPGSYTGNFSISAIADGYNRIDDSIPSIPNGARFVHNFTLDRVSPGTISGKVTDLQTGAAIVGASVYVGQLQNQLPVGLTDAGGVYKASNVLSGSTYVTVAASGYRPTTQWVSVVGGQTIELDFQLVPFTPPPHPGPGPRPGPRPSISALSTSPTA